MIKNMDFAKYLQADIIQVYPVLTHQYGRVTLGDKEACALVVEAHTGIIKAQPGTKTLSLD
jgi:hypothetical protein